MPDDGSAQADKYDARLTAAVEQLRANVKWTLVAFGAIGTTLLAGSQLSNLGKFHFDELRLWVALGCALVALAVAAYAVWSASKVANTGYVEFEHLSPDDRTYVQSNPGLLEGFASVAALQTEYRRAIATRYDGFFAGLTAEQLESNENWYHYLDSLVDKILSYVRYKHISDEVDRSRRRLAGASIGAAAALVIFAWAANPGSEQQTVVLQTPTSAARLTLNAAGRTTLTPLLGEKCAALPAIDVLLLSVSPSGSDVVTVAGKDCPLARFTLTGTMGKLANAPAPAATGAAATATPAPAPIVWTQLRPDGAGANDQLFARAIVARDAPCPALTVNGSSWPTSLRGDGTDPDFPVRYCEAALPGNADAMMGDVKLKPRPSVLRKIVVIGDTGCRITDYTAQRCDSAADWPFFRVAKAASALKPDLVIHVGDYHYREKPCAGRAGCTDSPWGDNWGTWNAEFFAPAAPLLAAAPWLMMRGNHEDCTRAGAGWNLLIRPKLGLTAGERCPADAEPDIFTLGTLRLVVPDTASAEGHGREDRVVTYRRQIRNLAKRLEQKAGEQKAAETWLLTHQALWVSYRWNKQAKSYDSVDLYGTAAPSLNGAVREAVCNATIDPMHTLRLWMDGKVLATNPNEAKPTEQEREEHPCRDEPATAFLPSPEISLVLSGDTHTFQLFTPDQEKRPLQLIAGTGGDTLETGYPDADKKLVDAAPNLFGLTGKLWMRNTFGFVVLEKADGAAAWTATLRDADGSVIATCDLDRKTAGCR